MASSMMQAPTLVTARRGSRVSPSSSSSPVVRAIAKSSSIRATAAAGATAAAVAPSGLSWPDSSGRAEVGTVIAEACVINLGARGVIATGLPFLDHMIDQLTSHCQLGVSVVVTKDGTACEPCKDASGADDVEVATAAGTALGGALKEFLAPGVAAVLSGRVVTHSRVSLD
jgi:hypothetical protein